MPDYNVIRTGIAEHLSANISWIPDADHISDYSPTTPEVVFTNLPHVVVDFDPSTQVDWAEQGPGYAQGLPFLIEIYEELADPDSSYGRDGSISIASKLKDVEDLFIFNPSIGSLVNSHYIRASKVEPLSVEAAGIGIPCRFAWLALTVVVI